MGRQVLSNSDDWNKLITKFEENITSGNIESVSSSLKSITISSIPRDFRVKLANVAQRCDLINFGLKILFPIMKNEKSLFSKPTIDEILMYSSLLIRNNLPEEGIRTLNSLKIENNPKKDLYLAHANILQWNFTSAIKNYLKYLSYKELSLYQRLVAQLNLSSCYAGQLELDSAENLINEALKTAELNHYKLICGNCYEIKGQIEIHRGDYEKAKVFLEKSISYLSNSHTRYLFYVKKWKSIITAFESRDYTLLPNLKKEANELKDWESCRELDLYQSFLTKDNILLQNVIYGTPSNFYHYRVKKIFKTFSIDKFYLLNKLPTTEIVLNLKKLHIIRNNEVINIYPPSKLIFNLLKIFLRDFYRPISISRMFYLLYPDEHYNPYSSHNKVNSALFLLRKWLRNCNLPIKIHSNNNEYKLLLDPSIAIQIENYTLKKNKKYNLKNEYYLSKALKSINKLERFSTNDLSKILNKSQSYTLKIISKWKLMGVVKEYSSYKKKYLLT